MSPTAAKRDNRTIDALQRVTALAGLALIAATWRLWTPQDAFPQVPLVGWAVDAPLWCDWLGFAALLSGMLSALIWPRTRPPGRVGLTLWIVATIVLILLDQHRLQPWAWQFFLIAVVLATVPTGRAVFLLQLLTISLYGHSALSKLDASFIETHGQTLLAGLLNNIAVDVWQWPPLWRKLAAASFPLGELAVAVALVVPRWRRIGLFGSLLMHVLLIATVGPWGLNHKPGVLLWNTFFLVQNVLLFGSPLRQEPTGVENRNAPQSVRSPGERQDMPHGRALLGESILWAAVLLPLLEPFDRFDHWPAWGLYAARPEKVGVYVHASRRSDVARDLPEYIAQPPLDSPWCRLRIDRWSLDVLDAPVYPQDRFRSGIALAIARQYDLRRQVRVVIESSADRWTGRRSQQELIGVEAISRRARQFYLNAEPRQ